MRHAKCMSNTLQTSESHNKPSTSLPRHVSRPGENSLPQLTKWTHLQPLCRRARLLVVTNQQHFCCHLPASICQKTSEPPPPQPGGTHGEEEPAAALHPTTRGPQSWTPPLLPRAFHGWAPRYPSPFLRGTIQRRTDWRFGNQDFSDLARGPPVGSAASQSRAADTAPAPSHG